MQLPSMERHYVSFIRTDNPWSVHLSFFGTWWRSLHALKETLLPESCRRRVLSSESQPGTEGFSAEASHKKNTVIPPPSKHCFHQSRGEATAESAELTTS